MTTTIRWSENGTERTARWRSENGAVPPREIVVVDDDIAADSALRMARSGTGILWRGDFHNARQLLRALDRRLEKRAERKASRAPRDAEPGQLFHANRLARSQRAAILGKILVELETDHTIELRRAPDVRDACGHAYGEPSGEADGQTSLVSLPEILGVISAYEWHRTGIEVAALGGRIYPAYGVFAPTRDEYIGLVADAPWPEGVDQPVVFDIGTGTGVLAALLARRGAGEVVATDINPRAAQCAVNNMNRLGTTDRVRVEEADLWPAHPQRADVVVCNPPWIPGRPTSALEQGIYDPKSDVLTRFLGELTQHLTPGGQGWLILSDLAEHLGLRTREEFLARIESAGLTVVGAQETTPRHPRAADEADPLHVARSRERTTLWRLGVSPQSAGMQL
ncbi:methyltransferase [Dietzia alimentaria]|uniref:methyltransferase n=1 Tax=Dietzia alimentaria TaxID=665550 RepID=UPI00029B3E95|nr:class I SAM-dependent methyltransferase [Dietzia alimentaria]